CAVVKGAFEIDKAVLAGGIIMRRTRQGVTNHCWNTVVQMRRVVPGYGSNDFEREGMQVWIGKTTAGLEELQHSEPGYAGVELLRTYIHSRAIAGRKGDGRVPIWKTSNSGFQVDRRGGNMILRLRRPNRADHNCGDTGGICDIGRQRPFQNR